MEKFKVFIHYLTPKYFLTCLAGFFARRELGGLTTFFIKLFIKKFNINMSEAKIENPKDFKTFNEFFTRELKDGVRPIYGNENNICMPVDGTMAEFGPINDDTLIAAKGQEYSLQTLLGGQESDATPFKNGSFACIYLSPSNYHRIHMPITGKLTKMVFIPGKYYSVNPTYVKHIPNLFAANERAVCFFETAVGPMAMTLVGATIVASIATIWHGEVAPNKLKKTTEWDYNDQNIVIEKGKEMGSFYLGSTVILCFGKDAIKLAESYKTGDAVKLGEHFADKI